MVDFIKEYTDWLYNSMIQSKISDNLFEVTTPFLDRHNEYTQIYISYLPNGEIEVNDYGYTLDDLRMSGFDFKTEKRKNMLNQIINGFGVGIRDGFIYARTSDINRLAETKHKVLQAMIYVNDMFILNRSNVQSLFTQDVRSYFDNYEIYYTDNVHLIGKSKFTHNFAYILQRNKNNPERTVKLMNHSDRKDAYSSIMFSWTDTLPTRKPDSKLIVLLNDNNTVSDDILDGFKNYDNEGVETVLWRNIDSKIKLFA